MIKDLKVEFIQLTSDNLEEVEARTNGSIKGLKLERHYRCVDFWNKGEEYTLNIRDAVMICGEFMTVISQRQYETLMMENS